MKTTFSILYLAILFLESVTPIPLATSDAVSQTIGLPHPAILLPDGGRKRSIAQASGALNRRAPKPKKDKTPEEKADDAKVELQNLNKDKAEVKATKEKERDDLEASTSAKRDERDSLGKEKEETDAQLSEEKKGERDQEVAESKKQKEEDEKDKDKDDGTTIWIRTFSSADWKSFYNNGFCNKPRGADNAGFCKEADIKKAFETCAKLRGDDKFLFWSSAGSDPFMGGAVKRYMDITGRYSISKAADECPGVAPMHRKKMKTAFLKYLVDEKERTNKGRKAKIDPLFEKAILDRMNYSYYWPVMDVAFAKAAKGKVVYLRPERTDGDLSDFPGTHWVMYERGNLKANGDVHTVVEVTMPLLDKTPMYQNAQPSEERELWGPNRPKSPEPGASGSGSRI